MCRIHLNASLAVPVVGVARSFSRTGSDACSGVRVEVQAGVAWLADIVYSPRSNFWTRFIALVNILILRPIAITPIISVARVALALSVVRSLKPHWFARVLLQTSDAYVVVVDSWYQGRAYCDALLRIRVKIGRV